MVQKYLREAALVVQDAQDPVRFSSNEVKTGLVVAEGLLLPLNLLPHVLLLHTQHKSSWWLVILTYLTPLLFFFQFFILLLLCISFNCLFTQF